MLEHGITPITTLFNLNLTIHTHQEPPRNLDLARTLKQRELSQHHNITTLELTLLQFSLLLRKIQFQSPLKLTHPTSKPTPQVFSRTQLHAEQPWTTPSKLLVMVLTQFMVDTTLLETHGLLIGDKAAM